MPKCFKCNDEGFVEKLLKGSKKTTKIVCKVCRSRKIKLYPFDNHPIGYKPDERDFIVVGAGIAGLAAGIVLKKLGVKVIIVEKDKCFEERKQGYGLTMQQGSSALRELGVDLPKDTVSTSHFVFNETGSILGFFGSNFSKYFKKYIDGDPLIQQAKYTGKYTGSGKFNVHIPRQDRIYFCIFHSLVRKLLLTQFESICPGGVTWSFCFSSMKREGSGVQVRSTSGEKVFGHVVLACDGIYSNVAAHVHPAPLIYLGCVVILGISNLAHPLLPKRVFETNDGSARLYVMPYKNIPKATDEDKPFNPALAELESYSTMWQLSFKVESQSAAMEMSRTTESLMKEALRRCRGWHDPIPDLIKHTLCLSGHPVFDREYIDPSTLQERLQLAGLNEKLVLLGDAAHPMSPFKGQGANQALLDASLLGHTVLNHKSFEIYHRAMIERSRPKVKQSKQAVDDLHCPEANLPSKLCTPLKGFLFITDYLNSMDITASSASSHDLDALIVQNCGYRNRPHRLHVRKVDSSRTLTGNANELAASY